MKAHPATLLTLIHCLILTIYAEYIAISITADDYQINQYTTYTFELQRYFNPLVFDFIDPVASIPLNSIIQLTFPSDFITISNQTNPACHNGDTGASLTCTVYEDNNTIIVIGYYADSSTSNDQQVKVVITNIKNPFKATGTANFQWFIKDDTGLTLDESPSANNPSYSSSLTFTPGTFASCSISADSNSVSSRSRLTFTLQPKNSIPTSGELIIDFPLTWTDDISLAETIISTLTCSAISNVAATVSCSYTILSSPVNIARITLTSLTSTTISTTFSLDITPILTPPYQGSQQTVEMYSQWPDGALIDTCTSVISDTSAETLDSVSFTSLSETVVQSTFNGRLQVTIEHPFYYQDQIILTLPSNFITSGNIQLSSSNFQSFIHNVDGTSATMSNFPSSPETIAANNIITIFMTQITNFESVQPQTITISFYRNGNKYQQGSTTYSAVQGILTSFSISSDSPIVNIIGLSQLQMETDLFIPADSYITLTYSSTISPSDISATSVTSASLGGFKVTGVQYSVTDNVITISSLFASTFNSGTMLVSFDQFNNPPTTQPTTYFLSIYSSTNYLILTSQYTYTAQLQSLISNAISSSSRVVMESGVTYTMNFETNYGYKAVSIIIPNQISVQSNYQVTCLPSICSLSGNNLTFTSTQTSGGVYSVSWGDNTNPNSYEPTSSFQVYTYSSGYGVQQHFGFITISMDTEATLLSSLISTSSYRNNDGISVTIDYTLPAETPTGTLSIEFPSDLDISSISCSQTCSVISPSINVPYTNTNTSEVASFSLIVSGVVNAPSFKPISDFTITLQSTAGYNSISSTVSAWTNTLSSSFTTDVSSNDGYKGEQSLFTFDVSGLSGKQTYVNIKINPLFTELVSAPTDATLVSGYEVRYDISGEGSVQIAFLLTTPLYGGNYTFSLQTYTSDQYTIGKSTTDIWQHNCFGTQCRSCTASGACIDCYDSSIPGTKNIYNTLDQTCTNLCDDGFFLVGIQCSICDANCLQCTASSTNCTQCNNGSYLNDIFDTCVQDCGDTFYANDLNGVCTACTSPCLTCTSDNFCLTCVVGHYLLVDECLSTCPAGVMVANDVTRICDYCDSNCLTCQNFDYECTSCNNSLGLYLQGSQCLDQCAENRFIKNNVCSPCETPCKICYNSTTTCSSCLANETTSLWFNYGCISPSQCNTGYFPNTVNGSCDICKTQCQFCSSYTNCSSCIDGYFLYAFQCFSACPNTTFSNDATRTCDDCTGCETCSEENVCTSCQIDQFLYVGQCYIVCPSGTYSQSSSNVTFGYCFVCPLDCPTCINATYCLSCLSQQFLYKGVCYGNCPNSTFESGTECDDCYETCSTCTSLTNCLSCEPSYSLQNDSSCVLTCTIGISFQQICYPCGLNCALCSGSTCQRCEATYLLHNNICVTQCSEDTLTLDDQTCVSCTNKFINCTTCSNSECLSCSDGQLVNGTCSPCAPGYYTRNSQCALCPSACTVCESTTYCTQCADNYYIQADYCVDTCPDNKVPNGTVCDICVTDCAICNVSTSLCQICIAGIYLYQGQCLTSCPSPLVVNLNFTKCVTTQQYYEEYSQAAKIIWFPFTIACIIVIMIGVALKCYLNIMHLTTFLVSCLSWLQLGSWILFGIIQYLAYINGHLDGFKGIICALVGIGLLLVTNIVFIIFYNKYFSPDSDFKKWEKNHCCINMVFVVLGGMFSFKIHRILYSKILDRDEFSMVLNSVKKLIPISALSVLSIFVSSIPLITGGSLALYFSISTDQQFFVGLDTLIVTGLMLLLLLLDLRHPPNYLIDELETQNIKNKIYEQEDDEKIDFEGEEINSEDPKNNGNLSRQNLLAADEGMDFMQTRKINNRPSNSRGANRKTKNIFHQQQSKQEKEKDENEEQNLEAYSQQSQEKLTSNIMKWIPKQFDHHGYLVKYDQNNNPVKYDENGYRVQIDEDGNHHKFDEDGNQVIIDEKGNHVKYNPEGLIIGKDGNLYDKRGYKVVEDENGKKYYDENGYQVIGEGEEQYKIDENGYKVVIDEQTKQYKKYNEDGYQVKKDKNGEDYFVNEDGVRMRKNKKGEWEAYDDEDGFILAKDPKTGKYQKFDQYGFKVQKDQYGNAYKYDDQGYRVLIEDGKIKRYDDQGFQIRKDSDEKVHKFDKDGYEMILNENGEPQFYDQNGYRVERDFYGNPTFYDSEGNTIVKDPYTGKHRKFNPEGLQIVEDENGQKILKDKRGRKVVEIEEGYYEKFDENGNKLWLDEDGYEVEHDEDGNILKYDKVGDLVNDDDGEDDFEGMAVIKDGEQIKEKKEKKRKFKMVKEFNFEEEYSKMIENEKPNIIFNDSGSEEDDLREFHDVEPPQQRQLQKQYEDLYKNELDEERLRKQSEQIKLEDLQDIDNTPYQNIKQKKIGQNNEGEEKDQENKVTLDPELLDDKLQLKSVVDASIDKRSYNNEGIQPISNKDSNNDDLESLDEIDPVLMKRHKKRKNRHSEMSFDQSGQAIETKSQNNFMKGEQGSNVQIPIQGKKKENKIYDSDQEVQSLGEEEWDDNEAPYLFYKNKELSNANTNANDKIPEGEDQEDILSDYIPQHGYPKDKASQQDLLSHRYMQSIEQVEDQLFDKLKSEDNRVKRTQFKLSGNPNPLVEYAKSIQAKKSLKEKIIFDGVKKK